VGLALIVGGGVGNLIDRLNAGVVRDFIDIGIGSIRTGVFNLADLAITVGTVVVVWSWRFLGAGRGATSPRR
jgi:signal peptidase II